MPFLTLTFIFGDLHKAAFESGANLIYQDEFHDSLITAADQIMNTIYGKTRPPPERKTVRAEVRKAAKL